MSKESHYQKGYGAWVGNPIGKRPDFDRCCQEVRIDGWRDGQCSRKCGHGPDGAYCKQHDPAAVNAREEAKRKKWEENARLQRPKWYARKMLEALKLIADGHNDPRSIAKAIVDEIER